MKKEISYSHKLYFCPYCGFFDTEKDQGSVIEREDLPIEYANTPAKNLWGFTLTIQCPVCKKTYKAEQQYQFRETEGFVDPDERIEELEQLIETLESEIEDSEHELWGYREELEQLKKKNIKPCLITS